MKKTFIILSLLFYTGFASAQFDSVSIFQILNEYSFSVNRTIVGNDEITDGYGFGLGIYHTFRPKKKFNIALGFEFNQISEKLASVYNGHFSMDYNVSYRLNYITFPLSFSYNVGRKVKWFIEAGAFIDILVGGRVKGTSVNYNYTDSTLSVDTTKFNYKQVSGSLDVGLTFGTGIKIPVGKHELFIKPELKYRLIEPKQYDFEPTTGYYVRFVVGFRL
jgi:hypothetical protein